MQPRVFPRAGEKGKGSVPHSGPQGAGAASPRTHREGLSRAAPEPARDGDRAGARSNERHRHPLRAPTPAPGTVRWQGDVTPAPAAPSPQHLPEAAAGAWRSPPPPPPPFGKARAPPPFAAPWLRNAPGPGESGPGQASAAPGAAGNRRRDQQHREPRAGRGGGGRTDHSSAHPTGSRPHSRPHRRTAHALFLEHYGVAVVSGSTCWLHVLEIRWRVSGGKYGNAGFWTYACGYIR